jgi:Ca-activated chloride channel homolog
MRQRLWRGLALFVLILSMMSGCSRSNDSDLVFYLYGEFTNSTGSNPEFNISSDLSDSEVYFDGIVEYEVNIPDIKITMNNLSLYSTEENYFIDQVEVEEKVDDVWIWYPEFSVEFGNLTQLGVVLVLDVSESLGSDFNDVLNYAVEFVRIVSENSPEARIGVVCFSDVIHSLEPMTNIAVIENFIYEQEMGPYTKMYDAMAHGIERLSLLEVDGRALVTFTDGRDNYSLSTPAELVEDINDLGIRSYTMGLQGKGGVNSTILQLLAVNGQYRLTSSKNDLRKVFQFFAQSVSNVYQVSYTRSSQIIAAPRLLRYKLIDNQ